MSYRRAHHVIVSLGIIPPFNNCFRLSMVYADPVLIYSLLENPPVYISIPSKRWALALINN